MISFCSCEAALVNYNFLAHAVWTTDEAVGKMRSSATS
jgi:hypothetical protein